MPIPAKWLWLILAALGAAPSLCQPKPGPCQAVLTAAKPKATCALPPLAVAPPLVEVPVTKIENPAGQSFSIWLLYVPPKGDPTPVGNVTVFPPDRTGVFTIRTGPTLERHWPSRSSARLAIEVRPTDRSQASKFVSVSIGPLRWLTEEPK